MKYHTKIIITIFASLLVFFLVFFAVLLLNRQNVVLIYSEKEPISQTYDTTRTLVGVTFLPDDSGRWRTVYLYHVDKVIKKAK